MEDLEKQIKELSINYTSKTDKEYLKQFGQFFTLSPVILNELLHDLKFSSKKLDILEPSVGTGLLILECMKFFKNFKLDAIEIDKNIYDKTKVLFETLNEVVFINADFLQYDFNEKKYDLIIGNPPYFEITKDMRSSVDIKTYFNEILSGRTNIYSLFLYKCINLLKPDGQLVFIIPKTILSGKYFSKLREFINENCDILDIIKFDDKKLFKKVLQSIIILKLKKHPLSSTRSVRPYTLKINDEIYFVKDDKKLYLDVNTTTISKLSCTVKTGNIVWNQHKELLSDNKTDTTLQLIMANNIKNGTLILNKVTSVEKKQYLTISDKNKNAIIYGPYILINRIVGLDPPKLNVYFCDNNNDNSKCFIENHVNVIKGDINNLTQIYNSLKDEKTIIFIKELIGNTQLSQYELENIIPIFY